MTSSTSARAEMPFTEHLRELRTRLVSALLAIIIAACLCYNWVEEIFYVLTLPVRQSFDKFELIGTGPTDAFICKLKVAVVAGLISSTPLWFQQLWLFIEPGLNERERRFSIPFVIASTFFFLSGIAFCYFLVLPIALKFFAAEFVSIGVSPNIRIGEYLGFVVKMLLVFGGVFELPVVSYFLARLDLLTHTWLIKNFRYSIVLIFVIAGVLTPPDVASQTLLAGPLLVLYWICVVICYFVAEDKKRLRHNLSMHKHIWRTNKN